MAKFHIRLKVQALELEIDGERQDIPQITSAVQRQFSGLIESADVAADGHKDERRAPELIGADAPGRGKPARKVRSTRATGEPTSLIDFRHESGKYGNPIQTWSVVEKCVWILFVLKKQVDLNEVSASQLTATFNHHFKGSGKLHPPNVTRELTKAKAQNPAPVGEDKGLWFLTDEGERQAKALVEAVLTQ